MPKRHAEALVMYFLDYYGKSGVDRSRGVRVIVFSRFDGEDINPEDSAIEISMNKSVAILPLDMFLYNTTGKQTTGYHYDPVFQIDRRKRPRLKPDVKEQLHCIRASSQQTVLPKSSILDVKSKRLEGLQKKVPTYLNTVDPFRKNM